MKRLMKRDRARHNVLQLSKFGLMQITRQRVRPVVEVDVQEVCPTCGGKGRIQPSILFTDTLDEQIELYNHHFGRGLKLFVHPFVFAYANKGLFFRSLRFRWFYQYGVRLRADESLPLLEFRFVDRNGQTVQLPRMTEESADKKAEKKAKLYTAKAIEEKPEVVLPKAQPVAEQTATADITESGAEQPAAAPAAPAKAKRKRSRKKKNSDQIEETSPLEEPVSSLSSSQAEQDAEAEKVAKKKTKENVKDHMPVDSDGNEPIKGQVHVDEVLERNIELLKDETGLNKEQCLEVLNECDNNIVKVLEKWSIVKKLNYQKPFYALVKAIKENWTNNKKEVKKNNSKFFNFESHDYDYDELERQLLGWT